MKINKIKNRRAQGIVITAVAALIVGIPISVSADSNSQDRATAELRSLNDSGVSGRVTLRANGSEITIKGKAKGLDPDGFYVSLLYDILSVATGAWACEPGFDFSNPVLGATEDAPGRLTIFEMGIDAGSGQPQLVWVTKHDDERKSTVRGTVSVNMDRIRTISIRDTRINGGIGPEAVVACGLIVPKK